MATLLEVLVWRLTLWLVRLLWLPLLAIGFVAYIVLPALAQLAALLFTPAGVLFAALLLLWLWRR